MSDQRSGNDRRSGVNKMLFFDRRSGKDRRSKNDPIKTSLKFRGIDIRKSKELNNQIKPNLLSSRN
jgi:hypothetical protein